MQCAALELINNHLIDNDYHLVLIMIELLNLKPFIEIDINNLIKHS